MLRTFNCGLGLVLIVSKESEMEILAQMCGHGATTIGYVTNKEKDSPQVIVKNFDKNIAAVTKSITLKKRVL